MDTNAKLKHTMKYTLLFLFFGVSLTAQISYSVDSIGTDDAGTIFAIKKTETLTNGQQNTVYLEGEYDTTGLAEFLLAETVTKYRQASHKRISAFLADREARQLQILAQSYIDSTFYSYTQPMYAGAYEAKGDLPNLVLRIGNDIHYLRGFIVNNLFRVERVTQQGDLFSPRDITAMFWLSNLGIRLQPLDITNEVLFLDQFRNINRATSYLGTLSDGTQVVLTHLKQR